MKRFTPGEQAAPFSFLVNIVARDARDAVGARLFPNGTTTFQLRVTGDGVPAIAGCSNTQSTQAIVVEQTLRVANP